ncbi:Cornifin (SPRR) family, putative [Trypanosoma equiperdum]|nr:Cornifin (SPRR) family, putative [Trypanosoma equiperdum]
MAAARQSPLVVAPACPPTSDGLNATDGTGSGLSKSLVIPSAAGGLAVSLSETQQTRGYGRETEEIFSGNHPTSNPNLLSHSPLLAGLPSWNIPSASSSTWAGSTVTQVFVPQLDAVPARSVILPTAVWFDDRLERVVVPRVNATSSVPKGLQEEGSRQRLKPSFKRVKDKYLWRLPPSKEGIASELWRGVYWKHVDVHRYVSRRYFGGPPPVE